LHKGKVDDTKFIPRKVMPKAQTGYYAVKKGRVPGVYSTWNECEAQTKGEHTSNLSSSILFWTCYRQREI
jgi:viroplasmin and RNaseH domain-containing protein